MKLLKLLSALILLICPLICSAQETSEVTLTRDEIRRYSESFKTPEVLHLRQFLDNYVSARNKLDSEEEGAAQMLDALELNTAIYKSKLIVFKIENALVGGKSVTILFQDHQDIMLNFWVYQGDNKYYQVRASDKITQDENVIAFKKAYAKYLNDKNLAL